MVKVLRMFSDNFGQFLSWPINKTIHNTITRPEKSSADLYVGKQGNTVHTYFI